MTTQVAVEKEAVFRRRQSGRRSASGNITQTLNELGIDKDLETEMVVQTVTENLASEVVPEWNATAPGEKFQRRMSESRMQKAAEKKLAEEQARVAAPMQNLPDVSAYGPKKSALPKKASPVRLVPKPGAAKPVDTPTEVQAPLEVDDAALQMNAPPSMLKGRIQKPSPALGKLGTTIAAMMPGAERVRVEKRLPAGNLGFIADYSKQDLASHPDLQSFLSRYVKPAYGAGEYKVTGLDSMGRTYEAGSVHLLDPPSVAEGTGAMGLVQGMLSQQQKNHEEQIKELKETMHAQPNPVTMLRDVTALQKELTTPAPPQTSNASESTLAAVITSSAQNAAQMMQMMMQQQQAAQAAQQQQTMVMVQQMQAANQQQMTMFLEMMKQKETSSSSSSASPMPPPPPPDNPMTGLKDILGMLGEMGVFGANANPPDDTFKQIVLANQLGVKDVLSLVKEMAPTARESNNGMKEAFDNLAVVLNIATQLKQNTEGSPQATIWDAVAALVSNKDFAGSIASAIRVNSDQVQRQSQNAQQMQLLAQQRALQLAAQQRQQAAMQQRLPSIDEREIVATPPQPRPAPVAEVKPAAPNVAPTRKPKPSPQPNATPAPTVEPPNLPAGFETKVSSIVEAVALKDDAQIVEKTVNMVLFFYGFEQWKPVATSLLAAAQSGDKEKTLEILGGFMGAFIEMRLIDKAVGNEVLRCIDTHFDTIHSQLSGKPASILPQGVEEVFVVPDPEEIDETGNFVEDEDEDENEDGEGEEESENEEDAGDEAG